MYPPAQCKLCDARLTLDESGNQQSLGDACLEKAIGMTNLSLDDLNALPYGVITVNQEGVVSFYNDWEQQLSGRPRSEVIGKNFFTEVAPCTRVQEFGGRFTQFLESSRSVGSALILWCFKRTREAGESIKPSTSVLGSESGRILSPRSGR